MKKIYSKPIVNVVITLPRRSYMLVGSDEDGNFKIEDGGNTMSGEIGDEDLDVKGNSFDMW